jgi:FkbM family methyltransferase
MNYFTHLLHRLKLRGIEPSGFIDVGAHFGETHQIIRSVYPSTRIVSFEANPACEPMLRSIGAECIIGLLGKETKEKVSFYINPNNKTCTGCSTHKELSQHYQNSDTIYLPMFRLDEVVPIEAKLDFLKIDVQGAEIDVLDGSTLLLPTIRWIYLEVSLVKLNEGAPLIDDVFIYLRNAGYKISDICDSTYIDNRLIQTNLLFEKI